MPPRRCALLLVLGLALPALGQAPTSNPGELKAQLEKFLAATAEPEPPSQLRAEQIRAEAVKELPRGGPDSIAGIGDWWLSNGHICAAISGLGHDGGIVGGGGTLVDIGHCDRPDDQWNSANMLTGLAKETAIVTQEISAQIESDSAEIITTGEADGLRQRVTYRLREDADALEIDVEIARIGPGRPLRMSGLFSLYSQRSLTPFTFSSFAPEASLGFRHPEIDRHSIFSLVAGMKANDWNVLVGADPYPAAISYGVHLHSAELVRADGRRQPVPRFLAVFPDYSLHGWMSRPLWIHGDGIGWAAMLQNRFMDLEDGERLVAKFKVLLGRKADVASVTDQLYRGPQLRGYSNHPGVSFEVWDQRGRPLTQVRASEDGSFNIRLPKGVERVRLKATAPWGEEIRRELNISDIRNDSGRWLFTGKGELQLPRGHAMSLTFFGVGETADPAFGRDLLGFTVGGERVPGSLASNRVDLAGSDSDPLAVALPPGHYRVVAGRGLEYGRNEYLLTVVPGMSSVLPIVPPQRIWSGSDSDWVSADLHVHSGASFDSSLPFAQRLRSFVAQGAQVLVATEHNRIVDFSGYPAQMGLADKVQVITGTELTGLARSEAAPYTVGHSNAFPLRARPSQYAGGIIGIENRRLRDLIADVRQRWPAALFQLNHPRASSSLDADLAFFNHLSIGNRYDPEQSLLADPNRSLLEVDESTGVRDIDFDAMEVLSGTEFDVYPQLKRDWFSLLSQGAIRTATGNSDSHGLANIVAAPRNYVSVPAHGALPISEAAFTSALLEGRSYITTGPFLDVKLQNDEGSEAHLGDTLAGRQAQLHVQVDAAPWVPVDTLSVWVNGELYRQMEVAHGERKVIELIVAQDAYIVVEVSAQADAAYREMLPGLRPVALSNPIYLDANGDGDWSAPRPLQ